MVKSALATLGIFATNAIAGALAGREADTQANIPFSLESWVSGIIADPDGAHLSPDEALNLTVNQTSNDLGAMEKRAVRCNTVAGTSASVADAVWCIDFLARRSGQRCGVPAGGRSSFCRHGLATIQGVSERPVWQGGTSSPCGNVARSAGRIMDKCTRGGTVQGENTAYGNGYLAVHIRRP
ncbi:hypothetical protein FBEOM_13077 [Fusarium beomiforme]|uniref:Ecp2 effector protein domain-containing protein n=1 Tax=Fusarium beomiforme TaxID=44412 RepID=A0A9P5A6I2_9HYPO|nr:hypothetical protein FBEOM_13077 [Fusarium beomiforme]